MRTWGCCRDCWEYPKSRNTGVFQCSVFSFSVVSLCDWMDCSHQAPPSMGFSRQEYWGGLPFPCPGGLPSSGMEPMFLASPALAGGFFTTSAAWEVLSRICTASWCCVLFFEAFHSFILEISSRLEIKSERQLRVCSNMGKSGLCSQLYQALHPGDSRQATKLISTSLSHLCNRDAKRYPNRYWEKTFPTVPGAY